MLTLEILKVRAIESRPLWPGAREVWHCWPETVTGERQVVVVARPLPDGILSIVEFVKEVGDNRERAIRTYAAGSWRYFDYEKGPDYEEGLSLGLCPVDG